MQPHADEQTSPIRERSGQEVNGHERAAAKIRTAAFILIATNVALGFTSYEPSLWGHSLVALVSAGVFVCLVTGLGLSAALAMRGTLPWTRTLLGAVVLLEWTARALHEVSATRFVHAVAVVFELWVLVQIVQDFRRRRAGPGELPEARIASALVCLLPPLLARVVALECVILSAALLSTFRRVQVGPGIFGYSRTAFFSLVLPLAPLVIAADWLLVYALIPSSLAWLRLFHTITTAYFVVWLLGMYTLFRTRPQRIDDGAVQLHCGLLKSARVPLAIIESATVVSETDLPKSARLDVRGAPRVELKLREPIQPIGLLRRLAPTERLLASADDANGLCSAIDQARRVLPTI
jgi:hypothetical protein